MAVGLLAYLQRNGSKLADVVVLVACQGQATLLRKAINERVAAVQLAVERGAGGATLLGGPLSATASAVAQGPGAMAPPKRGLAAVRVSTIDNYQGEEADIVVLSLVRSAPTTSATFKGFMRESNRVCVAFSRARRGLYILGNAELHRGISTLWRNIVGTLEAAGELGLALPLACHRHPDRQTACAQPADWEVVASGGCSLPCGERLDCGHVCPQACHSDTHEGLRCTKSCARPRACGHPCRTLCFAACGQCQVQVTAVPPKSGHDVRLPCSKDAAEVECQRPCSRSPPWAGKCSHACAQPCGRPCPATCPTLVKRRVPGCPRRHEVDTPCGGGPPAGACLALCGEKLDCGHDCSSTCAACTDTAGGGRLHARCKYPCTRRLLCGHDCASRHPCSEPCPPCVRPCESRCEHSRCQRLCSAPCVEPCRVRCAHHSCSKRCGEPCNRLQCDVPCASLLTCGHACIGLCGEPCPTLCRVCDPGYFDSITQTTPRRQMRGTRFYSYRTAVTRSSIPRWMAGCRRRTPAAPREPGPPFPAAALCAVRTRRPPHLAAARQAKMPKQEKKNCPHGRQQYVCKECGGVGICAHGRVRSQCKVEGCRGASICPHGRERSVRKVEGCGGASICIHGRQRSVCKVEGCGGGSICPHGRVRYYCAQCGGAGMCVHGRGRRRCKEGCGGQALCVHLKDNCKACKAPAPGTGAAASGAGGSAAAAPRKRMREEEEEEE
jgi:hypothetical protein